MPTNEKVDERAEYQCTYAYHNDLIKSRFTVAGLYLAASGIVLSKVAELATTGETLPTDVLWICLLMVGLAIACLCLEGRTRFLYQTMGKRFAVLEDELGDMARAKGKQTPLFYFCYTEKEGYKGTHAPLLQQLSSHTFGFRLLYRGSLFFWVLYEWRYFAAWQGWPDVWRHCGICVIILVALVAVPWPLWKRNVPRLWN